jgi:HEAT repeat protein
MKRWLPLLVLAAGLGVGGFILWPYLVGPTPPTLAVTGDKPPAKGQAEGLDPTVKRLFLEYDAHLNDQPIPASRKLMVELATLGPNRPLPVSLVEAWLHRMHEANLGDTPEFREMAGVLRALNPDAAKGLVAEVNRQGVVFDLSYHVDLLLAFGKTSVPVLVNGLQATEGNVREAGSVLPVVLARFGPTALPDVRNALQHQHPAVRRQAIRTVVLMGADIAGPARQGLETALKDQDGTVRTLAALAMGELGGLGDHMSAAPSGLAAALQDTDPLVRLAAARSLVRSSTFDRQRVAATVIALLKAGDFTKAAWSLGTATDNKRPYAESKGGLFYDSMYWEETAAHVLIELGPKYQLAPEVVVGMLKECPHDGRHIVHLLAVQGEGEATKKAVLELAAMIKDKDSRQRRKALLALGRLGLPRAAEALPEIRAALKNADGRTRWRALLALALLEPSAVKQALPAALHGVVDAAAASAVHPRLDNVDKWTRCQWQYHPAVLLAATSEGAPAFKNFEPWTLSDEEVWIEKERVDALLTAADKAGPKGEAGVQLLLAAWQANNRTPSDRKRHGDKALDLLTREGAAAQSAVPSLVYALGWYETSVLAKALVKIGDAAVPELAKALDNLDIQDLWPAILIVLREFGPKAEPAMPAVLKFLNSSNEGLAQLAAATLGSAGAGAEGAVPELRRMLTSPLSDARRHTVDALGLIGPPAKAALPDLIGLFKDDNQQVRVAAVRAVSRIGKDAVEPLTVALESADEKVRLSAVEALMRMDRDARPALAALQKLDRDDQPPAVRTAVQDLVKKLDAK